MTTLIEALSTIEKTNSTPTAVRRALKVVGSSRSRKRTNWDGEFFIPHHVDLLLVIRRLVRSTNASRVAGTRKARRPRK